MNKKNWRLRPLTAADDLEQLTTLLHRAYKVLADMGLNYVATWQTTDITADRVSRGECYVIEPQTMDQAIDEPAGAKGPLLATIIFESAAQTKGCPWYDRPEVASFHQFAVDPRLQGQGLGSMLLDQVEQRARDTGAREIALDTADQAHHLIAFYKKRGYREVGVADWKSTNYQSVILSRALSPCP